jgi:hypothetical protein
LGFTDISDKKNCWREIAKELNGEFVIKHTISGDLEILCLKIPFDGVNIEFTESDTQPFKVNFTIPAKQKISFSISEEDSFEKILKLLGQQDIVIGNTEFDKKYLVQGGKVDIVKGLLNYDSVKLLILKANLFSLLCDYKKKDSTINIVSVVGRFVNSKSEMLDLHKLFCLVIEYLKKQSFI